MNRKEGGERKREMIFMEQGSTKQRRNMKQIDFVIMKTNYIKAMFSVCNKFPKAY